MTLAFLLFPFFLTFSSSLAIKTTLESWGEAACTGYDDRQGADCGCIFGLRDLRLVMIPASCILGLFWSRAGVGGRASLT